MILLGRDGVGKQTVDTAHGAIEGKLAHCQGLLDEARVDLTRGEEIRDRNGQVETRTALAHARGCEIDDDVVARHVEAGGLHGTANAQPRLLNGRIGHADDVPAWQTRPDLDLDRDGHGLHAIEGAGGNGGAHCPRSTH